MPDDWPTPSHLLVRSVGDEYGWKCRDCDFTVKYGYKNAKKAIARHWAEAHAPRREERTTLSNEVKLAAGLLCIASHSMPDTFFQSDSRCELAREVLRSNGYDPEEYGSIIEEEN